MSNRTPTFTDVVDSRILYSLADVHTSLPCRVIKYYPEKQCVDAQPLLRREYSNGWVDDLPVIQGLPVVFQGAGNSLISFPIASGDIVLAVFSERSLDKWVNSRGQTVDPQNNQLHDLSDAFAIPGLQTYKTHNNPNPDNLEVRFGIGSANETSVKMKTNGNVEITAPLSVTVNTPNANYSGNINVSGDVTISGDATIDGDAVASGISLVNHTHGGVSPGGGSTGVPE